MISAEDLIKNINPPNHQPPFRLGVVSGLFELNGTAQILFDGESEASDKEYAYLSTYIPEIDDRVLLCVVGGTYVILGKISYNIAPSPFDVSDLENSISELAGDIASIDTSISTINTTLLTKIDSNMDNDVNGNMNIDYMYVDPTTKRLNVRRKNGLWTGYANVM